MLQEKLTLVSLQRLPRFVSDRLLTDAKMSIFAVDFCHFFSLLLASALFPSVSLLPEPTLFDFAFLILLMRLKENVMDQNSQMQRKNKI